MDDDNGRNMKVCIGLFLLFSSLLVISLFFPSGLTPERKICVTNKLNENRHGTLS